MATYTAPLVDYAAKDAMSTGNPSKLVKGEDFTNEFEAIAAAFATSSSETEALIKSGTQNFQTTYWDGTEWVPTSQVRVVQDNNVNLNKFEVTIDARFQANNIFGTTNDDVQFFNGDCYIGYPESFPNNNDTELGTLFLGRGVIVGRPGVGDPKPTASIGMEDNVIYDLGDPFAEQHAVNQRTMNAAIAAGFRTKLKDTLAEATSFEDFKARVMAAIDDE